MTHAELHDIVVITDNRPGILHEVAASLGEAGINIEGLSTLTSSDRAVIHLLVPRPDLAVDRLRASRIEPRAVHETVVANLPDRPNALAEVLQPIAAAGINVSLAYVAVGVSSATRIILVTDDPALTRTLLSSQPRT